MIHAFDSQVAIEYGLNEAIILNHLRYWIVHNAANEKNFYDGRYWTYNTNSAFCNIFPYLSERKIRNALKHLQEKGIIMTGNYNKSLYDRTLWYAFTDKGASIFLVSDKDAVTIQQKSQMDSFKSDEPIPNINTKENSCYNSDTFTPYIPQGDDCGTELVVPKKQEYIEGFDAFYAMYPKHVGKAAALKAWKKLKPNTELQEVMAKALMAQKQSSQWNKDGGQYIPNPATWLNQRRWEDEVKMNDTQDAMFDRLKQKAIEIDKALGNEYAGKGGFWDGIE